MTQPKTLQERLQSPTPRFFKKIRNAGLVLAAISAAILATPVALPAAVVQVAGYLAVAGSVATAVAQTTTGGRSKKAGGDASQGEKNGVDAQTPKVKHRKTKKSG